MDCSQRQTIFVKIGRIGFKVTEYAVLSGSTGEDILKIANYVLSSAEMVSINGIDQNNNWIKETILDRSLILIKPKPQNTIKVRVARIGEALMEVSIPESSTVRDALVAAGRLPFENEEIWLHVIGFEKGTLIGLSARAFAGSTYIIEPKKNLRNKILRIISDIDDEDYGDEKNNIIIDTLCLMLKKDYNLV